MFVGGENISEGASSHGWPDPTNFWSVVTQQLFSQGFPQTPLSTSIQRHTFEVFLLPQRVSLPNYGWTRCPKRLVMIMSARSPLQLYYSCKIGNRRLAASPSYASVIRAAPRCSQPMADRHIPRPKSQALIGGKVGTSNAECSAIAVGTGSQRWGAQSRYVQLGNYHGVEWERHSSVGLQRLLCKNLSLDSAQGSPKPR